MFGNNKHNEDKEYKEAVLQLKKGSAEAFQILYHRYHNKVYKFCLRILGDEALAKDAFQETFIKVYEHRKNFRGENFAAWLFTIARHTCLNQIRGRKDFDTFDEGFHSSRKSKNRDIGLKEQIEKALETLPLQLREALVLREYQGFSYKEIADILKIDLSLAKVRVFRAREILRKLLKPLRKELHES